MRHETFSFMMCRIQQCPCAWLRFCMSRAGIGHRDCTVNTLFESVTSTSEYYIISCIDHTYGHSSTLENHWKSWIRNFKWSHHGLDGHADGVDTEKLWWLRCPSSLYLQVVSPGHPKSANSMVMSKYGCTEYAGTIVHWAQCIIVTVLC